MVWTPAVVGSPVYRRANAAPSNYNDCNYNDCNCNDSNWTKAGTDAKSLSPDSFAAPRDWTETSGEADLGD